MSIESLAIALHHSRLEGTARLVLIGIANHDGDGGAWPSVQTLARYAHVHPRTVQKVLPKIVAAGEIRIRYNAGGQPGAAHWSRPNLYEFLLTCPPSCDRSKNHRDLRGDQTPIFTDLADLVPTSSPGAPGGTTPPAMGAPAPLPTVAPEPSYQPADNLPSALVANARTRAGSMDLDTLASVCPAPGAKNAPHDFDPVSGWCVRCSQARDDGALRDHRGMTLREAVTPTTSKEATHAVAS